MKNTNLIILISFITLSWFISSLHLPAQTNDEMPQKAGMPEEGVGRENTATSEADTSRTDDTTSISLGRRQIVIIDKGGDTSVSISERDEEGRASHRSRRFRGNWSGLELGLNNFVDGDFSISLGPAEDFMELRTGKSWNVNLNMLQYNFTVIRDNVGIVTGLGLEFNDYRFTNNNSITKLDRVIVPVDYTDRGITLDKTKLSTVYITVPLLAEFQTRHRSPSRRAYISAGVVGGVNIGSHTKVSYYDSSRKQKDKVRDDFYLSPFRYGLTVRTGYRSLNLYANYYPTPLFRKNRGPELFPVAVGFSIKGF